MDAMKAPWKGCSAGEATDGRVEDRPPRTKSLAICFLVTTFAVGCSTHRAVNSNLEAVAKDWCRTIRASQVSPVYPLTEDVQPGDVFLAHMPIQEQQQEYEAKGYLPLDYHIARLPAPDYAAFYGTDRYYITPGAHPPANWQFKSIADSDLNSWRLAPRAAFPTYSFSVSRSGGLNVGIPVNGIPLGLNLLGSSSATGTVTIADAYTYGVDMESVLPALKTWAGLPEIKSLLSSFPPRNTGAKDDNGQPILETSYLRVITRVYLTGRVNISMYTGKAGGGTFSAGEKRPVELLTIGQDSNAVTNIESVNRLLRGETSSTSPAAKSPDSSGTGDSGEPEPGSSGHGGLTGTRADGVASAVSLRSSKDTGEAPGAKPAAAATGSPVSPLSPPGGSVQVAMASSRSVSLQETFPRPLVIGYLGFDVGIEKDGRLGKIYSTVQRLEGQDALPTNAIDYPGDDACSKALSAWLNPGDATQRSDRAKRLSSWMAEQGLSTISTSDFVIDEKYRAQRIAAASYLKLDC